MNPLRRIGPYLYAATHSYQMVWELAASPRARRTAERDEARLRARFPFLASYPALAAPIARRLAPAYADYIANVSPDPIAISLPLAVFLAVICEQVRPGRILDLGSGFSSYVFRAHAASGVQQPAPTVDSIDQSQPWLDQTRAFLRRHDREGHDDARRDGAVEQLGQRLATWDQFAATEHPPFDLILQDIATLDVRRQMLDRVLAACRPGGMIVIDDMHVPGYRRAVLRALDRRGLSHFSLRAFTRKRLRYAYLVLP
jgi:predicted O-methyltransferase YrrM